MSHSQNSQSIFNCNMCSTSTHTSKSQPASSLVNVNHFTSLGPSRVILNFDQSKSVNYDHIWACLTGLFWSCACLLFWAFVFNFNSNVNFFSPSELAAPLASRLGEGYAAAPAQLAGRSVRRAADRTSMPVSTARGADAASAGRRRRRQSPGACAVRGPLKPQCAVAGSRLADILLELPDGDSWALRFGALPIGRAGPGGRRRCPQCRGSPNSSWVTRMGDFFLLHRCCECWPLSGSDWAWHATAGSPVLLGAARQRARGQRDRATAGNRAAPDAQRASGRGAYHAGRAGVTGGTAEVRLRSTFPDRQAVQLLTGDRQLHAPRAAGRSLGWTTQLLDRRLASTAMALPCASCRTLVQRRRPWPSRWSHWNEKTVCAGWRARHACQPTAGRRVPQLKRAALRPAADEADRLPPADRWALGRLPDGRRVRELRWSVRPPSSVLWCAAATVAADWHQSNGAPDGRQLLVGHGALTDNTTPGHLSLVLTVMFQLFWRRAYLSYSTYLVLRLPARNLDFDCKMLDVIGGCHPLRRSRPTAGVGADKLRNVSGGLSRCCVSSCASPITSSHRTADGSRVMLDSLFRADSTLTHVTIRVIQLNTFISL